MLVFKGLTLALLGGMSVGPFPVVFQRLSSGFIPDVFGGEGFNYTALFLGVASVAAIIYFSFRSRAGFLLPPRPVVAGRRRLDVGEQEGGTQRLGRHLLGRAAVDTRCFDDRGAEPATGIAA